MDNMDNWNRLKSVPRDALKEIQFGKLTGKHDINPVWRAEIITTVFGMCGIGWKYDIVSTWTHEVKEEVMLFVQINLYVKNGESWSDPIPAIGGDFVLQKDKNGLHGNDEAYKMAITDALGYAMKYLGVAADVYRGLANDSKYGREPQQQESQTNTSAPTTQQKMQQHTNTATTNENATDAQLNAIQKIAKSKNIDINSTDTSVFTKQQASDFIKELNSK
jgi:hypothetical protein